MDTPVIDMHSHVGRWAKTGIDDSPPRYLRIMDEAGVDRACINCIFYGDASRGNDVVAGFVARNPDRFLGVAFVTPHYPQEAIREMERAFDVLGMRFLKLYPDYFGRPIDDPGYTPIFEWAEERGIIIADTKFEFGLVNGVPTLIDEMLTPDSSRFWPMDEYQTGMSPPSLDKQFVRDYLEGLDWDKKPPAPSLPQKIISNTAEKYRGIYRILTGEEI